MFITIFYIILLFLRPDYFFPELAQYRPMLWLGLIALAVSVVLGKLRRLACMPQAALLFGVVGAMLLSELAGGWLGGMVLVASKFAPCAIVFYLVAMNLTTVGRVKIFTAALAMISMVVIALGLVSYHFGYQSAIWIFQQHVTDPSGEERILLRLTGGAGFLQDPNDYGQFLLVMLPLVGVHWRSGRTLRNTMVVLLPTAAILYSLYLTRSRGALVGCAILGLVAFRRKLGSLGSAAVIASFVLAALALNFSGGRAISIESGTDRLELWSSGLQMFKASPIFGVGFDRFTEHTAGSFTAHNSFVLCLAELGLVGFSLWLALLNTSIQDLLRIGRCIANDVPDGQDADQAAEQRRPPFDATEMRCYATAYLYALVSFIATSWFLSRTYMPLLYLLTGAAGAMAVITTAAATTMPPRKRVAYTTAGTMCGIIALVYLVVNLRN